VVSGCRGQGAEAEAKEVDEDEDEEEPGPQTLSRKSKSKSGAPGQETSVFHGKSMTDYQGRSYMSPSYAEAPNLHTEVGSIHRIVLSPKSASTPGQATRWVFWSSERSQNLAICF
jgi:hypothetical protein